jgi:gliding motility-associated-like protein
MKTPKLLPLLILMFISSLVTGQEKNLYWVGGQGNWSDLNKWRTEAGLLPDEVPDENTNVFFNQNSFLYPFDTVFITTGNPTCKNMIWQNIQDTVVLFNNNTGSTFNIYGSLTFHPKVYNEYRGTIRFSSTQPGNTVTCAGPITRFSGNVWFDGTGEWTLMDTLFVHDGLNWQEIIYDGEDPDEPDPVIIHVNGRLDANGQTIITRGFASTGNLTRQLNIVGCDILIYGDWTINAENLTFNAAGSYFLIRGNMNHTNGTVLTYDDIDFLPVNGAIRNTKIRTVHRKIHFLGAGELAGNRNPGVEGMFTADTVIFEGAITMAGPVPNFVRGPNHIIHYTQVNLTSGTFDVRNGNFHRVDFNGNSGPGPNQFMGLGNSADSIHFFAGVTGLLLGNNTVNDLLYFNTTGIVTAEEGYINTINHAVFNGDGFFERSNHFNLLTLSEGHWYQLQYDSLTHPGSIPNSHYMQTVFQIELQEKPGCGLGGTWITSKEKYTQAILNYLGPPVTLKKVFVQDIDNTGPMITIQEGYDVGNNNGFNFIDQIGSRTLYWVNGGGDWSDPNHWSLTSGGTGGECPPTIRDNVFFDAGSGFAEGDVVFMDLKNNQCKDFIWLDGVSNHPWVDGADTVNLRVWGSFILNPGMTYGFFGKHYFESVDDDDYQSIFLHYTFNGFDLFHLWNQTYFYSETGKWRLDTKFYNLFDTVYFKAGDLLIVEDTMSVLNFSSNDTLYRKLSLLGKTLVEVRQWQATAWEVRAHMVDEKFFFDAGESVIRSRGDIAPPPGAPPGFCHIRSWGDEITYHNIEFGYAEQTPEERGIGSMLLSESMNTFNLIDYYIIQGEAVGTGIVDTLTFKEDESANCFLRNQYFINFVISESPDNMLVNSHVIDTVLFYREGIIYGGHFIGYLEAHEFMDVSIVNRIDTAVFYGNAKILGRNQFSQLVLTPNQRYWFQQENQNPEDTTIIVDDLHLYGFCDQPIRIQSDSTGTQAKMLYMAQNPSNPDLFAEYASIRDIRMVPYDGKQYVAEGSVDLGNNTGILFNNQNESEIYYWIGGTGNWGDAQHWSYSSGGPPISEQCTPNERTTVVFDDNSFLTPADVVYVDVENAYCKSMYWVHNPDLFNPVFTDLFNFRNLNVFGSMMLNPGMVYDFSGFLIFDQYNEPGYVPDTLTTFGHTIWNHIYLQGIDDVIVLGDDLTLYTDGGDFISRAIFHEHGTFKTNGKNVHTGGYFSVFKNERALDIVNSTITLETYERLIGELERTWWVDGDNFSLSADNSNLVTICVEPYTIFTEYGDYLKYHNVFLNGLGDSLANKYNVVEYNVVEMNEIGWMVTGDFIADTVWMKAQLCAMFNTSTTNVVIIDARFGSINQNHKIGKGIINRYGIINGSNYFNYCVFNDDGAFYGKNVFDTLVLYPGAGDFENQGNKFYFQSDTAQVIIDSLYVRGNPCSNISLISMGMPNLAYLRKDNGNFDVSADFLNIFAVGAQSENLTFYAGANSSPLPDPNNPPPGWIFDNALGYIPGFNGRTERFCLGDPFVINASDFNGDPSTQYFWEGSQYPGGTSYVVTEPGQYHIRVLYFDGCYVDDYINLEADLPPNAFIAEGPFCEGDPIEVFVQPESGNYSYTWFNGETTSAIVSDLSYTGGIYVTVTDNANNCKATPNQTILVKPTPNPQAVLGGDVTLKYGESITLDAGEGDFYEWTSVPLVDIENPNDRQITVPGLIDPVEYHVYVELDGCPAEGFKLVSMYPPSRLGVPTAFSPNGDGVNDELRVYGSGFYDMLFRVYNRYGQLVFETRDSSVGWDGTVNGVKQEMEVYTYYIRVVFQDQDVIEETGNITLLR